MLRSVATKTALLSILALAFSLEPVFAQNAGVEVTPVATKFDEYGSINSEDHAARLNNWALQLQNLTGSKGYVVVYAPRTGSEIVAGVVKDYLINTRGISAEQVEVIHGGLNDVPSEPRVQLWVAPLGAEAPEPKKLAPAIENFKGKFGEIGFWDNVRVPYVLGVADGGDAGGV